MQQNPSDISLIQESPWAKPLSQDILRFFPHSETSFARQGLYSQSLDRFLLVDSIDIWSLYHAAQLLSSKLSTVICLFSFEKPAIQMKNCLFWSLQNKNAILPKYQTPLLHEIRSPDEMTQKNLPPDFEENRDQLFREQEFALFVLRAVYAMRVTELKISLDPAHHNESQKPYLDLFSDEISPDIIRNRANKTIWKKGFLNEIGSVIYRAQSIENALQTFHQIQQSIAAHPDSTERKVSDFYIKTFMKLLGG